MSFLRVASVALLVTACATNRDESAVQQEIGCPTWMCGSNSPEIDHLGMHDLNSNGLPNDNHFFIKDVEFGGSGGWTVTVERSEFVLTRGMAKVTGFKVIGAKIVVNNTSTGSIYDVLIENASDTTTFWAQPAGGGAKTFSYVLKWSTKTVGDQKRLWRPVCTNAPQDGSPDLLGMNSFHSVVFEDDKISEVTKTVTPLPKKGWFNIGCAGHALAKLHLMAHTQGAQNRYPLDFKTNGVTRTAALKMIVGDYCGTGMPFTVAGQPLEWADATGFMAYASAVTTEARWTERGAACLEVPRVLANPTPAGTAAFPTLLDSIKAECGDMPPACTDAGDVYNFDGNHMISGNP